MSSDILYKITSEDMEDFQPEKQPETRDRTASVRLSVLNPQLSKKLQKFDIENTFGIAYTDLHRCKNYYQFIELSKKYEIKINKK